MAGFGWRVFFLALGLDSMLWLAVWLFFMPDGRTVAVQKDEGDPPGVAGILCQRSAWFSFFGLFCGALATIILPVSVVRSDATAMVLLMLASAFIGMWSSNLWAITQTLAGPRAAGKWCAVQNGVGNLAVAAPWVTGWVSGADRALLFRVPGGRDGGAGVAHR